MDVTITTKYDVNQRVWMPDGNGGLQKGRVKSISIFHADLSQTAAAIVMQSLNYRCIDEQGETYCYHEYQLQERI